MMAGIEREDAVLGEARTHQALKANFLMSPPLVVAFALAGTVLKNVDTDPIGNDKDGLFAIIFKSQNHYQKRAYQIIKMLVHLFSK